MVLHILVLTCAVTIESLEILFEFSGAIACGSTMFLFPGIAYILALRKYGKPSHRQLWSTFFYHTLAWAFLFFFVILIGAFTYLQYVKASGLHRTEEELESSTVAV